MTNEAQKALDKYLAEQKSKGRSDDFLNFIRQGVKQNHLCFNECMCRQYGFTVNDNRWNRCSNCGCL